MRSESSRNNAEAIVVGVDCKGENRSGVFGQSRDWATPSVVTSVASTWGEVSASGGMEYRSHLIWWLLVFVVACY